MATEKKPNLLERFLFGPDANKGILDISREQKAVEDFVFSPYNNLRWNSTPGINNTSGTYGGSINYMVAAGDLIDNSAVMACMNWLMRNFPKSTPRVVSPTDDGLVPIPNHALTKLLKRPTPYYAGTQLWQATVLSYNWNGNAYWRKVRNNAGNVTQLWYEPHWSIRPVRASASDFISFYEIWRDRMWKRIETTEVVHFRWGLDPRNYMLGLAPLASALREVFTDNEASRYAAIMFKNLGVPGVIISPADGDLPFDAPTANRLKAEWEAQTTGDQRGTAIVSIMPTRIDTPQTDPAKMDTTGNRRISEERISALLLLPAAIAGLGAGLAHSSQNNRDDDARRAFDDNIIPSQDSMAEELDIQLLPDFTDIEEQTIEFDQSQVRVLRGDQERKNTVSTLMWNSGGIKRSQYLNRVGYKSDPTGKDDVYKTDLVALHGMGIGTDPAVSLAEDNNTITTGGGQTGKSPRSGGSNTKAKSARPKDLDELVESLVGELKDELDGMYDEVISLIEK